MTTQTRTFPASLLLLFLLFVPLLTSCSGYVERVRAAEREKQVQREQETRAILSGYQIICRTEGFTSLMDNEGCVQRKLLRSQQAETTKREAAARKNLCEQNEINAWLGPTQTGGFAESVQRVNEARALCEQGQVYTPPAVQPNAKHKTTCSLIGTGRRLPNNMVTCRWNCGGSELETIERIGFGCQNSPVK